MRKITSSQWDNVEYNAWNSAKKIGFYNADKNCFEEIVRWRNAYNKTTGSNYGLLQIWTNLYSFSFFEKQGSRNQCGGYNKPIANLESCLYQFEEEMKENPYGRKEFKFSSCGSIDSLINELKDYLQYQYKEKLFIIGIC